MKVFRIFFITLFTLCLFPIRPVNAQGNVSFTDVSVENDFPNSAIFRAKVSIDGTQIVSAQFVFSSDGYYSSNSYTKRNLEIEPSQQVDLEFVWDTAGTAALPWSYLVYYWDVVDTEGNHYKSEEMSFRYDDTRFNWNSLESENVGIWWHDKPDAFGQAVFQIATRAIRDQRDVFGVKLDYPVRVVIYNNFDEYAEWRGVANEWVGGETFSNFGVTVQIVENSSPEQSWLQDVVPHEISHLYFAQAVHNPKVSVPHWLNEGVAQYNEYTSYTGALNTARNAARNGDLISLTLLANGFGSHDVDRVYLSYAESLSAVKYMADTYGPESIGNLLRAYQAGNKTNEAFQIALGIDSNEFELGWARSLGAPDDYVVPTPRSLPTLRPAPIMFIPGNSSATQVPVPQAEASPTPESKPASPRGTAIPCLSFIPVFILGMGTVIFKNRKQP